MASSKDRKAYATASIGYNAKDSVYNDVFGPGSPLTLFQESDIKILDNNRKTIELRDIQLKAAESSRSNTNSGPTNGNSSKSGLFGNSTSKSGKGVLGKSRVVDVEKAVEKEVEKEVENAVLSKSAKKRMKDKEKALRSKENKNNGDEICEKDDNNDNNDDENDADLAYSASQSLEINNNCKSIEANIIEKIEGKEDKGGVEENEEDKEDAKDTRNSRSASFNRTPRAEKENNEVQYFSSAKTTSVEN